MMTYDSEKIKLGQEEGIFEPGETVTLRLYDKATRKRVPIDFNNCVEILDTGENDDQPPENTGKFVWWTGNITTKPTTFKQYTWTMTDSRGNKKDGNFEFVVGGDPIPANMCKVYADISEPDDSAGVDPNELFSDLKKTYAEIKGTAYFFTRFFVNSRRKPSYDQQNRRAYWLLPQGASVKFFVEILGINKTVTIPKLESTNLNDLISGV